MIHIDIASRQIWSLTATQTSTGDIVLIPLLMASTDVAESGAPY
jgi:hypothetical protein